MQEIDVPNLRGFSIFATEIGRAAVEAFSQQPINAIPSGTGADIEFWVVVGFDSSEDESTEVVISLTDASGDLDAPAWDTAVSINNNDCLTLKQQAQLLTFAVDVFERDCLPKIRGEVVGY